MEHADQHDVPRVLVQEAQDRPQNDDRDKRLGDRPGRGELCDQDPLWKVPEREERDAKKNRGCLSRPVGAPVKEGDEFVLEVGTERQLLGDTVESEIGDRRCDEQDRSGVLVRQRKADAFARKEQVAGTEEIQQDIDAEDQDDSYARATGPRGSLS